MCATRRRRPGRGRLLLLALACLVGSGACAKPQPVAAPPPPAPPPSTIIVLLPDADGSVGQVTITNASGTQVLTQGRQASSIRGSAEAPSAPYVIAENEVKEKFGKTLATLPPEPVRFILYFRLDSDDLTPESQALLPDFFRAVRERTPADVSIVGHTDTVADRQYNYRLGLRRANRVADLLVVQGVDRRTLDIDSHGKDDLLIKTGDQVPEPLNRRVEITVR
jgi:outer membrane protein OmpA-like peptidoglycan-associated protein